MIYRICRIVNTALSLLFILFAAWALSTDFSVTSIIIVSIIITVFAILLWFNFICTRLHKQNNEQRLFSKRQKNTGKVFFILVILCVIGILVSTVTTYFSFLNMPSTKWQKNFFGIFLSLFVLCAGTAIVNLVFFSKLIRRNTAVVNEFLNDIGQKD
jgi:RsiW-degrading membrane proteinase PrsW (M82 family)